jgi:hypothetical protein
MAVTKLTREEAEELDESAKIAAHLIKRYGDNVRKSHVVSAANDFGVDASKLAKTVRTKLGKTTLAEEEDDGWYTHSQMHGSKKSEKHPKGISAAEWKSGIRWHHGKNKRINIKEELEELDELSAKKLTDYTAAASDASKHKNLSTAKLDKRYGSMALAHEKVRARHAKVAAEGYMPTADEPTEANKKTAQKVRDMMAKEKKPVKEDTQIDELSKNAMLKYLSANKKSDKAAQEKGDYSKSDKRMRGTDVAVRKYTASPNSKYVRVPATEEAEQIDELSKATLGSYIKKATNQAFNKGFAGGANLSRGQEHEKEGEGQVNKAAKRVIGVNKAVNKLTKEEQDFVDALNNDMFEEVELDEAHDGYKTNSEKSKFNSGHRAKLMNPEGKPAYLSQKSYNTPAHAKAAAKFYGSIMHLPIRTIDSKMSDYNKAYDAKHGDVKESVELDEARGRPRKAGAKDFTIHPKTKEKLMHNNPADMKTIEVLQKNGILEKPKIEAGQHIMNQLSKAKTSMLGGSKIHFTHGDSKEVSGTHAAKILTKYAGMRPNEKEDFQKFVGHSHENLMKHV